MSRRHWLAIIMLVAGLALVAPTLAPVMTRIKEPPFVVEKSEGSIEIRAYAPMLAAEVETTGDREAAIGAGFRLLADYIFGNNAPNEKIAMTVPVTQRSGKVMPMTAPVTHQSSDGTWNVRFVLPHNYTLETLPKPNNPKVKIVAEPARRFAVIRFSGRTIDSNIDAHRAKLDAYVKSNGLAVSGPPVIAFYNPPWTIPFFKRNEVMYEVRG